MDARFDFRIARQPDEVSRGPTCLHAVYRHSGDDEPIERRAIFLGVLSYDGNLLIIEPGGPREPCPS